MMIKPNANQSKLFLTSRTSKKSEFFLKKKKETYRNSIILLEVQITLTKKA